MRNKIPYKFYMIGVKMKIETNMDKPGDVLHVYKNDSGLLALNTRTMHYSYVFRSMLTNPNVCEIIEIIK